MNMESLLSTWMQSLTISEFQNAKTDEDFIKTAMTLCHEIVNDKKIRVNYESKDDQLARENLNVGKVLMSQNKPLENVVEVYNQSMAQASAGSELLAHAYANRSIVLTNAARYEESLKDIQYALEGNYPDHLRASLYARKAKNLLALNPNANVDEALAEAKKWALEMDEDKRVKFLNDLGELKNKKFKKPVVQFDNSAFIPATPDDNPQLLKTSGAVGINNSEKFGRHLIATRDINAGEVLMVKKAYLLVLTPEYRFKCCWNCSKFCWSGVPCDKCSNVIYCSKECRDIAFKEHHDFECPVITAMLTNKSYNDSLVMSLRVLTKAVKEFGTLEKLHEKVCEIDSINDPILKLFDGQVYDDTKYASVYSLFRKPLSDELKVNIAMVVIWILHCLNATTEIFGEKSDNFAELIENDWSLFIGKLLFRHYQIIVSNMIAIELNKKTSDDKVVMSGGVLVPLVDLSSHSCDRNTYLIFSRDILSLICVNPIKKGEQINVSYGQDYREQKTSERRAVLKENHGFWCECFPCVDDWNPDYNLKSCLDHLSNETRVELLKLMGNCSDYCAFNSLESLTPNDVLKLLEKFFKLINLLGKDVSFPSDEMDNLKVLSFYILKWINSRQTEF